MQGIYEKYRDQGLQLAFVVVQNGQGDPATATYCKKVRDKFGYTFPMAYDPDGRFPKAISYNTNVHVLMTPDLEIVFKEVKPGLDVVEAKIKELLGL